MCLLQPQKLTFRADRDTADTDTADTDIYRAVNTGGVAVCLCAKHSCDCTPRFLCFAAAHLEKTEGVVVVARLDFVEIRHVLFYDPSHHKASFS